ncbi:MAG: ROK family protein, partial [Acidobacteriota bacterium]|nr:ROK family protein [Acidobacteriota bacterium]
HVSLDERGPVCSCGRRGCWEVYASNSAAIKACLEPRGGRGTKAAGSGPDRLTFDQLLLLAQPGDAAANQALVRMGDYLGRGIAMLATGLAPQLILVVGEVTRAWSTVAPALEKSAAARVSDPLPRSCRREMAPKPAARHRCARAPQTVRYGGRRVTVQPLDRRSRSAQFV